MKVIGDDQIKAITKQRDKLEVQLAKALLSKFKDNALWEVKIVCRELLRDILNRKTVLFLLPIKVAKAVVINNWLSIWDHYPPKPEVENPAMVEAHLNRLLVNSVSWSAGDCSDIIRLYGEIVEAAPQFKAEALLKETYRGTTLIKDKDENVRGEIVHDLSFAKGGVTHSGQKFGFRAREKGKGGPPPSYVYATFDVNEGALYKPLTSGITKSKLAEYDTVRKIDGMFALPEGASISGTTADSIFCTGKDATKKKLTGWLQLLPIATMVSQYHHTLLECALTLTLNKKVQYRIGFYRSLAPLEGTMAPDVEAVLGTYEDLAIDLGLVVYAWTNKNVRKGLLLEEGDKKALDRFKELAQVTGEHMSVWRVMAARATVGPAWELWKKHMTGLTPQQKRVVEASGLEREALARYGVQGALQPRVSSI